METNLQNRKKGYIYGGLTTVFLASSLFFVKLLLGGISPYFVALFLSLVIGFLILPILILANKDSLKRIKRKDLVLISFIGFLSSGLGVYLSNTGIEKLPLSESVFLLQFEAAFATLVAYLWLKEKMSSEQIVGTLVMIFGAYFLSAASSLGFGLGQLYILSATFLFGLTDIMTKKLNRDIPMELVSGFRSFFGVILLFFIGIPFFNAIPVLNLGQILLILIAGFSIFIFVMFLYKSVRVLPQAIGTLFLIPGLIFSALFGIVFFGETFSISKFFGALLIIIGLVIATGISSFWSKKVRGSLFKAK